MKKTEIKKDRKERIKIFREASKFVFQKIKSGNQSVIDRLGAIRPRVETNKKIRFMNVSATC